MWQRASWIDTLDCLPGLNLDEKAQARVLILSRPQEDRPLYFEGTYSEAVATVRALLRVGSGDSTPAAAISASAKLAVDLLTQTPATSEVATRTPSAPSEASVEEVTTPPPAGRKTPVPAWVNTAIAQPYLSSVIKVAERQERVLARAAARAAAKAAAKAPASEGSGRPKLGSASSTATSSRVSQREA